MPGYDLHPGVDVTYKFPPEVRAAIVAMTEMQVALTQVYDNARARGNHSGTQLANTISNFDSAVQAILATATAVGVVELATTTEVQTMTDTSRVVTPAGLAAASVSAATANRIIRRDANGRAAVANPSAVGDIANMGWVQGFADPLYTPINAQTGTTFTPALSDAGKLVTLSNAAAITVTLPSNTAVAFPIGTQIDFTGIGVGLFTIVAGSGATANGIANPLKQRARYGVISAVKISTNGWLVVGAM